MIWRLIIGGLWKPLLGILALAAMWLGGRKSAKTDAKIEKAAANDAANERMNNAPDLRNADDAARIKRLRDFAKRNGGA